MVLYAQIDSDNNLEQVVGFNTNSNAVAHCQANSDKLFVPTTLFGGPKELYYDEETGEVKQVAQDQ